MSAGQLCPLHEKFLPSAIDPIADVAQDFYAQPLNRENCEPMIAKAMRAALISLILLQLGCAGPGEPQANYANPSIVRLLRKACAGDSDNLGGFDLSTDELNTLGNDGGPPLLWLLMNCEDSQKTSSTLIRMGADPHLYSSSQKNSPARFATRNLPPSFLKAMLQAGMNPNYRYEQYADSPTLLFLAVMHRDEEKVEALLRHGAFIEERNASGDTPLLYI